MLLCQAQRVIMNISFYTASYICVCSLLSSEGGSLIEWHWRPEKKRILIKEGKKMQGREMPWVLCKENRCPHLYRKVKGMVLRGSYTSDPSVNHHHDSLTIWDWALSFIVPGLETSRSLWQPTPWGLRTTGCLSGSCIWWKAPSLRCMNYHTGSFCLEHSDSLPKWSWEWKANQGFLGFFFLK